MGVGGTEGLVGLGANRGNCLWGPSKWGFLSILGPGPVLWGQSQVRTCVQRCFGEGALHCLCAG